MPEPQAHSGLPSFSVFRFGMTSAEAESENDQGLFTLGYYDLGGSEERARTGREYLVLGYKGSGKSAIGQRLHLTHHSDTFVRQPVLLADFPFSHFSRISAGAGGAHAEYPTTWTFLLLVLLMEHFSYDETLDRVSQTILKETLSQLQQVGLMPGQSLSRLAKVSSERSFGATLAKVLLQRKSNYEQREEVVANAVEYLQNRVKQLRSSRTNILVLDGLDEVLLANETQYNVLSALIESVDRLNRFLRREGAPAKVVVLCRTDIFDRLPSANKNKMLQTYAIELDWYQTEIRR